VFRPVSQLTRGKELLPSTPGMTRKWKKGAHGVPSIPSMNAITRSGKKRDASGSPPGVQSSDLLYKNGVAEKILGDLKIGAAILPKGGGVMDFFLL